MGYSRWRRVVGSVGWLMVLLLLEVGCGCTDNSECDDSDACTQDNCVVGFCQHPPVSCDDGDPCTSETCNPAVGCVAEPIDCDDGDPCTTDVCDPVLGCEQTPTECDDGDPCTSDMCDPVTGTCESTPIDCDDGNPCTADSCDAVGGCVQVPIDCDDGEACTTDTCDPVVGCESVPVDCGDGNPCTVDSCDPVAGCEQVPVDCDDGDPCTSDACNPVDGCFNPPIDCNDGDPCTVDACVAGECISGPIDCDDDEACTDDSCDPVVGCESVALPDGTSCDDADVCNGTDTCSGGVCTSQAPIVCNDNDACTDNVCDPAAGCQFPARPLGGEPLTLTLTPVTFNVMVPPGVTNDDVWLLLLPYRNLAIEEAIPMTDLGGGLWTADAMIEEGALLRYVYRLGVHPWGPTFYDASYHESLDGLPDYSAFPNTIRNRMLLVHSGLSHVDDVVAAWHEAPGGLATGTLTGTVVDSVTGAPLMDTEVSVGGVNTATDFDGTFRVAGLAAGEQRVTVHRANGDHFAAAQVVTLSAGGAAGATFQLLPAQPVNVTFALTVPDYDLPPNAQVRMVSNLYQLGGRHHLYPGEPSHFVLPELTWAAGDLATLSVELFEGAYVQYSYTLGSSMHGVERAPAPARELRRSFVVDPAEPVREDLVACWRAPWASRVTVEVETPANTDPEAFVALKMGPSHEMTRVGPHTHAFTWHDNGGNAAGFNFNLGDTAGGDDAAGQRTVSFPNDPSDELVSAVVPMSVGQWDWDYPAPIPGVGELADVTFRVTVPQQTPSGAAVRIMGDIPALAGGVALTVDPLDATAWAATVALPVGPLTYTVDRSASGTASVDGYAATVVYDGQLVDAAVVHWEDEASTEPTKPDAVMGVYPPDFWDPGMLPLYPRTLERAFDMRAGYAALTTIWAYGRIMPTPTVESRPVLAPNGITTRPELETQVTMTHDAGLGVVLIPQFDPGDTRDGDQLGTLHDQAWWEGGLAEARRMWLWHATVAEATGVEVLLLPGPVFHVFMPAGFMPAEYVATFDAAVSALVAEVKTLYSGKILMSGTSDATMAPALGDYVGLTGYDIAHPTLSDDATVEEWEAAYEVALGGPIADLYATYDLPVIVYQLFPVPVFDAPSLPAKEEVQARRMEAVMRVVDAHPECQGLLSWQYELIDTPNRNVLGVRDRFAESVMARHFGRWTGAGSW